MHLNGQFKLKVSDNSPLGINLIIFNVFETLITVKVLNIRDTQKT